MAEALSSYEQVKEKILQLESALLASNPQMPQLLRTIHTTLKNDPAVVTLLSDEDIAIIIQGLKVQTTTSIVTTQAKPTAAAKKALTKVTTDDLGF